MIVLSDLAGKCPNWFIGLLLPFAIVALDSAIFRLNFWVIDSKYWINISNIPQVYQVFKQVLFKAVIMIVFLGITITLNNTFSDNLNKFLTQNHPGIFIATIAIFYAVSTTALCLRSFRKNPRIGLAEKWLENICISGMENFIDTVLVLDETGKICQANPAAESLFGRKISALIGCSLTEFFSELAGTPSNWEIRSEQQMTVECFSKNSTESANKRLIEITVTQNSKHIYPQYIVMLRDITERKQSEVVLLQSEALLKEQARELQQAIKKLQQTQAKLIHTEKMSTLGQLVAGIAHEINNPVTFIHGNITHVNNYSQDLLSLINLYQQHYPTLNPEIQNLIEQIDLEFLKEDLPKMLTSMKVGTQRISEIVLTLRNFSRLDEANMKFVNIHEGIDSTLVILQHRLKETAKNSEIAIVKEYANLPQLECYAGQLNQVLMNILTNALDALLSTGWLYSEKRANYRPKITISTQLLESDGIRISIKDNGPGMSDQVKARMFEPFFTTKPLGQGTGLGLAIAYQIIVEKHGGELKCFSQPGEGAQFWIELPICRDSCILKKVRYDFESDENVKIVREEKI